MRDLLIRVCVSAGLSVRRKPKRLLPDEPDTRPGDLVVCDWTIDGIQHTTHALDFAAPMPDGIWRGLSRAKKEARSLKVGVRAVEMEQGKRDNPGEPEAQAERGNTYTMQERCRRAQVHFWPIAIEVDGHCSASFLKFFTNVCNAAKELTEQNPQVPKLLSSAGGNASHVNFTNQTNVKLALQRAAAARRALFRLPTGADDELQNDELQTDLPAEVADRSSYRDRQRHFRNAWTSRLRARNARPTTHRGFRSLGTFCVGFSPREHKMAKIDRRMWAAPPASPGLKKF